ncbi:MAG: gluconokinase [Beutenbergiaceae bacterium]
MSVLLGLDIGTTAVKVVGIDRGQVCTQAERTYPMQSPEPGQQVQDPAGVLAAVDEVLATAGTDIARAGLTAAGLVVSTAMHALIGLAADGLPLTPIITWADTRSHEQAQRLIQEGLAADLLARTGTPVHPLSPLTKVMWFNEQPEVPRVRWWVGLKDLVLAHLTGQIVTEASTASATGMYNLRAGIWDEAALALAGIDEASLPPVRPTTAQLPLTMKIPGLPAGLPVVLGATDGPLGNLGVGAVGPGQVGLSLGTSGAVRMVVAAPTAHPALFCYNLTDQAWVIGAAISNGGVVLDWLSGVCGISVPQLLQQAGQLPAGRSPVGMVPDLLAERPPAAPGEGAVLSGLRRSHGRAEIARAAVDGVAARLAAVVAALDQVQPVAQVRATGGALRSRVWVDALSHAMGRPVQPISTAGGSALGAIALGALALGLVQDLAEAADMVAADALGSQAGRPPG